MSPPSQDQALPRLIVDGPDRLRGQVYELDYEPLLVGRDSTCRLQLVDPLLSRRHAVVWWAGGHTTVEDLSSTNGTKLNGHRVLGQQILRTGDVLSFGPLEVHYEEPTAAVTEVAGAPGSAREPPGPTPVTAEAPAAFRERAGAARGPAPKPPPKPAAQPLAQPVHAAAPGPAAARVETPPERGRPEKPPGPAWPGPAAPSETPPPPPPPPVVGPPPPPQARAPLTPLPRLDVPPPKAPGPEGTPQPRSDAGRQRAEPNVEDVGRNTFDAASRFDVDRQIAEGNLSNIGRDQVNYIYRDDHLEVARRETFFRKMAAARLWARHVLVAGLALALVGSAYLGWERANPDTLAERIGHIAHNAGLVIGVAGVVLLVVGGAVMIRAVIRQRRYEKDEARRLDANPSPSG
ncbi:FHA domain-containing protein [Kitasatospora sp. NPDC015120]|uniref:FHA domain-containing protein n=1 Tax=Kitasatospora sp. NPDC015120 TaxID=3364023 RepID=UPI0036F468CE